MRMEDCRVGMEVIFGRGNGEQTRGVIVKINRAKAKVKTLENRGSKSPAGAVWGVPYSLMTPVLVSGTGMMPAAAAAAPMTMPVEVPIHYHPFQDGIEQCILEAINGVYNALSPENLTCDGEATMTQVNQKRTKLNRQLRGLFQAMGREVSEKVAFDWYMERQKNERTGTNG
jgi:hypothetical protein